MHTPGRDRLTRRRGCTRAADGNTACRAGEAIASSDRHASRPCSALRPPRSTRSSVTPCRSPARPSDDRDLINLLAGVRFALLGEASHGSDDFYRERAALTRRLIVERGLDAVAVEADWPDAYRVNRYVRGLGDDASADAALADFKRFPAWMWRNTVVLEFVEWLREHNAGRQPERGSASTGSTCTACSPRSRRCSPISTAPTRKRPQRARQRYACFDRFAEDSQAYGYAARFDLDASCETAVVAQLREHASPSGGAVSRGLADGDADAFFHAAQNARLVRNAEEYYRSMFSSRVSSWNLRDRHMAETLAELDGHLSRGAAGRRGSPSGRTTRISAMPARPRWATAAS